MLEGLWFGAILMYPPHNEYFKRIEHERWSFLAIMAIEFHIEIEENGSESRKLKKEVEMLKHVIYEQLINYENNGKNIPSVFFTGMVKTIRRIEASFERLQMKDKIFVQFLKALLHKAKKERIIAVKPLERSFEFKKMKINSDRYDSLRYSNKDRT